MQFKDQLGRTLILDSVPKRIVSLVPSQTELLVDLGLSSFIIGVTKFCVHPSSIKNTAQIVGGTKQVHFDKISALQPDIIICNKEENTKEIVETCAATTPVWVSDITTIKDNNDMILSLGDIFKVVDRAKDLVIEIKKAHEEFMLFMRDKSFKKVAYLIWKRPYMAAGQNTFIDTLLNCNKFNNIYDTIKTSRYPEVTVASMAKADLILLSSEPYPFKEKDIIELKNELPVEVRLVDGEYFSWYGSRIKAAFSYFKELHV